MSKLLTTAALLLALFTTLAFTDQVLTRRQLLRQIETCNQALDEARRTSGGAMSKLGDAELIVEAPALCQATPTVEAVQAIGEQG